jgi:DNA-binding GntR family transcriptional regulator
VGRRNFEGWETVKEDDELLRVAAPLREQVVERLRSAILNADVKPGDRLVESALTARYKVSRPVIREALRQLEAEGLVTALPHRGRIVTELDLDQARDLYEIRASLEGLAGGLFAARASAKQRRMLRDAMRDVTQTLTDGTAAEQLAAKDRYYDILFEGSGNGTMRPMLRGIHARIKLLRGLSLSVEGRASASLHEMTEITNAAVRSDVDAASDACRAHVREAARVALAELQNRHRQKETEAS